MRLNNIRAAAVRQLEQAVAIKAQELRNEIVGNFSRPGTGRKYRRYNPNRIHQASSPGEAPAIDQGQLVQAITAWMVRPGHWRVGVAGGEIGKIGLYLEFGTQRIAPRPFVRPAVEKLRRGGN